MLQYFSINDLSRYLVLLLIFIVIRTFFLFSFDDVFIMELHWKGVTGQLQQLGETYVDVLHHLGTFSAVIFRLFYGIWGDQLIISRIFAALIGFIQVLIITIGLYESRTLNENNLFTGVIHIVLLHLFPDFICLSPILLGMTFICLAYVQILFIIKGNQDNAVFLYTGIFIAIALAFSFPLAIFSIPTLIIIIIYTKFNSKSIALYLFGLILPVLLICGYYYFNGHLGIFLSTNFYYGFSISFTSYFPFITYIIVLLIPALLFLLAFLKIVGRYTVINYKQKIIASGVFYLIAALVTLVFLPQKSIHYYQLFIPFLIHFFAILFLENNTNRKQSALIVSLVFLLLLSIPFADRIPRLSKLCDYSNLYSKPFIDSYGKVLNLSTNKNVLHNNRYATGFCEYFIARKFFLDKSDEATIKTYDFLTKELPDAIYDPYHIAKNKIDIIPELKEKYIYFESLGIYRKK